MNFDPNRDPDSPEEKDELENLDELDSEDESGRFLDEEESADVADEAEEMMSEAIEEDLPSGDGVIPPDPYADGPPMPPPSNFDFAYPQLFFFLFCSLAIAIGCLLPWERTYLKGNLTGADSIGGGFLLLFAVYGIISGFFNIYHRRMIVWPVILAAIDGCIIGWQRVVQLLSRFEPVITTEDSFGKIQQTIKGYVQALGPGLYLVTIFSTLILFSIIVSVFKGAKEDSRRKAEEREARAEARKSRKTSS